jgi:S1-C subfamily serine protease
MRGIMPKARADITNTLTMSVPHVLIVSVVKDSPADIAGIKPGDHVLSVDGKTLDGTANLGELIRTYKVGDTVTLEVTTLGETAREVKVVLSDNPNQTGTPYIGVQFALEPGFGKAGKRGGRGFEGMQPFLGGGAVVRSVTAGSPAEKAGIEQGDSIVSVNGKTMATPVALIAEIASLKIGDEVTLGVKAQGATAATDIKVTLGENPNKAGTPWLGITLGGNMRIRPGRPGGMMPGGRGFEMPGMGGTLEDIQPAVPAGDTL